ncbi:MAG: GAF domain-containing protein [Cyanobacteria bacterium P01_F01_bin.53]
MPTFLESENSFNALQQAAYQLSSCTDQIFLQIRQEQALASIVDRIRSSMELVTLFETTTTEVRELLKADRVGVFQFKPGSGWNEGEFVAENVAAGFPSTLAEKVSDHCFGPNFAAAYTQGRVQAISDIYSANLSDCHIQILEQFEVRANLIVPVLQGDSLWGFLCVHQCSQTRRWQLGEIEFVKKIAGHFAIALQQSEYVEQLQDKVTRLDRAKAQEAALFKITNRIRRSLDWEAICDMATEEVRQLLGADRVAVYRFNPDWSGDFVIESVADDWKPLVGVTATITDTYLAETQGGRYTHNENYAVEDIYTVGHDDCHVALLEEFQARAYSITPIFQGERLWGLLAAFQNSGPRQWRDDERTLLAQIGEQLGIALQQAEYVEQLQDKVARLDRAKAQQTALFKITSRIRRSLGWETICETATEDVRQLLGADRVAVYRFNSDWSGEFVTESVADEWKPLAGVTGTIADTHLMDNQGGRYANNENFAVSDIYTVGHDDCHVALLEEFQARAYAIAPIFQGERLWGLLAAFQNSGPRDWQDDEITLLTQIGEQLGIALQQSDAVWKIQSQSVELQQMLEDLKKSQAQQIQNEKMASLGQLVAGVAHEINNPVNFIHGNIRHIGQYVKDLLTLIDFYQKQTADSENVEIYRDKEDDLDFEFLLEDFPKMLGSMKIGTERIREIVLSLRNFSRLDESEFKAVDIHEGINSTLLILGNRIKDGGAHSGVEIIKDYGELPPVECYPAKLNQVFMNLLSNALDAIEEAIKAKTSAHEASTGSQKHKIWISTQLADQGQVEVRIRDSGIGVPEDIAPQVFDHFFTTKPVGEGTGLGLAISRKIIMENHLGTLSVNATPGQGAEFIIRLPLKLQNALAE